MALISIITPVYNEALNIFEFYKRITATLEEITPDYEILFIDDGSTDHSIQLIEKLSRENKQVRFISFTRNFGHQIALFAGLEHCIGEKIVLLDSDLQDPPELITDLYDKAITGYDVVYAKRRKREGESLYKKASAKLYYRIFKKITSINIPLDTGDFRIISRKVRDEVLKMNEPHKFLRGQVAWLGFSEDFILYDREPRKNGKSAFSQRKMFHFALDGITGFSNLPLKIASFCGIIVSFIAFLMIIYVFYAKLVLGHTITGWASIMITILFLGGIQLFCLGVIGEYIIRINDSVKNRQLYIVKSKS